MEKKMKKKILPICCMIGIFGGFIARFFLEGNASRYALGVGITVGFACGFLLDLILNKEKKN